MNEPTQDDTNNDKTVTLDDLLNIERGEVVVARTQNDNYDWIFAGEATWTLVDESEDPRLEVEEALEQYANYHIVSFDPTLWLDLSDGEIDDRTHELQDRPQYQPYLAEPPKDAPPCALTCRKNGGITVTNPTPIYGGGRIKYYAPDDYETVIALDHGVIIDPKRVIPDGYDSDQ